MPDSFSSHGRAGDVFARALQGCRIAAHFRVEAVFKSHGTSVPVRLLAIDKVSGQLNTTVVQRTSLAELLPFIDQMPARLTCSTSIGSALCWRSMSWETGSAILTPILVLFCN
ncbi:hypothetical protein [Novosphingobium sp.]|uniref:hypothetical protein n=1 Tax=Novosphingobium sp. TaxID=1874826 RepID=UPI003D0C66F5